MTVTVIVKPRAWPAKVTTKPSGDVEGTETLHQEKTYHLATGDIITIEEIEPTEENSRPFVGEKVPGAEENDKLLGKETEAKMPSLKSSGIQPSLADDKGSDKVQA